VVARLWAHIKRNNLQNPNDKREIILDVPMQNVFKVDKLTMFSINKALVPHLRAIP
jgi:chromatin remodeling complex protein RSC6